MIKNYFTKSELILWFSSCGMIMVSFVIFDRTGYLTLIASLIGAASLIFKPRGAEPATLFAEKERLSWHCQAWLT